MKIIKIIFISFIFLLVLIALWYFISNQFFSNIPTNIQQINDKSENIKFDSNDNLDQVIEELKILETL